MTTTRPLVRRPANLAALGCAAAFVAWAALPGVACAGLGGAPMATPSGAAVSDLGRGPVAAVPSRVAPVARAASEASEAVQPAAGAPSP